jgi:hypothetical protein
MESRGTLRIQVSNGKSIVPEIRVVDSIHIRYKRQPLYIVVICLASRPGMCGTNTGRSSARADASSKLPSLQFYHNQSTSASYFSFFR